MSNNQNTKVKVIKPENIVFESDNGTNIIIDNGSTYILSHKNGICCCFDHEKKLLRQVINAIKCDGNFQVSNKNTMGFYIADSNGKMQYNLAQLIICTAYHKRLQNIQHHNVKYIDGNILNYCLDNLDCTAIPNSRKVLCDITHDDKLIYVHCKFREKTGVLDYSPKLFKILSLSKFRWTYRKKSNTITSPIFIRQKRKGDVSLHQLAYIFYHYQEVTHRNILTNIRAYKANFAKCNLEVDHLDSDRMNDCEYNISAMDKLLNISKSNITAKIIAPFFHYAVYANDAYRVAVGMYIDKPNADYEDEMKIQMYQCNTAESYVELLKRFYDKGMLPNGECLPMSPKKWYLKMSEEKRQPIDQTLPKVNKEDLIDELLKADNLPLYLSGNGKGVA